MSRQEGFASQIISLNDLKKESKKFRGKKNKKSNKSQKHGTGTRLAPTPPPPDAYDPNKEQA